MSVYVLVCETRPLPVTRTGNLRVSQFWGGGTGEKKSIQYFEFGLQYLVQSYIQHL